MARGGTVRAGSAITAREKATWAIALTNWSTLDTTTIQTLKHEDVLTST